MRWFREKLLENNRSDISTWPGTQAFTALGGMTLFNVVQGCAGVINEKMSDFHQKIHRHHSQCFLFSFVHSGTSLHWESLKYLQERRQVENNMANMAVRKDVLRASAPTFCLRPMGPQVLKCERRVTKKGKKERSGKTLLL